jgi:hypothetical protein
MPHHQLKSRPVDHPKPHLQHQLSPHSPHSSSISLRPPWTSSPQSHLKVLAQFFNQPLKQLRKLLAIYFLHFMFHASNIFLDQFVIKNNRNIFSNRLFRVRSCRASKGFAATPESRVALSLRKDRGPEDRADPVVARLRLCDSRALGVALESV